MFTIVTANGEIRSVTRDSPAQKDKDLYWVILGGNPGAFGVTTNLIFHPLLDEDYPHYTCFSSTTLHSPKKMKAVFEILKDLINRSNKSDDNALAEGLELMVARSSNKNNNSIFTCTIANDAILFELGYRDMKDEKAYGQMQDIIKRYKKAICIPRIDSHDG